MKKGVHLIEALFNFLLLEYWVIMEINTLNYTSSKRQQERIIFFIVIFIYI